MQPKIVTEKTSKINLLFQPRNGWAKSNSKRPIHITDIVFWQGTYHKYFIQHIATIPPLPISFQKIAPPRKVKKEKDRIINTEKEMVGQVKG